MASHSFHVLLRELIPRARADQSHLFTHLKGARTDHIINLRAHHAKTRGTLTVLTAEEQKPHSAEHTLRFLEDEYVEKDDDAPHYTWSNILTTTRQPMGRFIHVASIKIWRNCQENYRYSPD